MENDVKVKFGKHSYEVEQLFSSQATIDRQELIFALGFKAPERGIAHKIALEHRHETEMKVNRIELMLPGLIKFETHVIYNLVDNQSKRKLDAGLTYFENEIASTLEMVHRPDNSGIDGAAHLRWGQPNDPNTQCNTRDCPLRSSPGTLWQVRLCAGSDMATRTAVWLWGRV